MSTDTADPFDDTPTVEVPNEPPAGEPILQDDENDEESHK
jgi:hypothetical protein